MARCSLCYRERGNQMAPIVPGSPPICKGCTMDVDRTLGFLSMHGYGLQRSFEDELHLIDLTTGEVTRTTMASIREAGIGIAMVEEGTLASPGLVADPPGEPPKPPKGGK